MIYDITLPLRLGMSVWPGDPQYRMTSVMNLASGDIAAVSQITLGTHTGTHVDAPAHLFEDGTPVDRLPLEILTGEALVLDCGDEPIITAAFLTSRLSSGCQRILMKTLDEGRRDESGQGVALDLSAAQILLQNGILLVGISGASVDAADSGDLSVHKMLLQAGVVIIENLALQQVPQGTYQLCCLPLPLAGADAAPARVILKDSPRY